MAEIEYHIEIISLVEFINDKIKSSIPFLPASENLFCEIV